ncbi:MAG TPA: hypothetical protein VK028_12380 [Micromonosporaceae bacterium]|nr:hypothetical protein [Micromonosporaceae bacterium]
MAVIRLSADAGFSAAWEWTAPATLPAAEVVDAPSALAVDGIDDS